jgi:CheY-like chemotaxis protein
MTPIEGVDRSFKREDLEKGGFLPRIADVEAFPGQGLTIREEPPRIRIRFHGRVVGSNRKRTSGSNRIGPLPVEIDPTEDVSNGPRPSRKPHRGERMDATQDSGLRILLVEDNEAILKALGSLLKIIGHSVIEAGGLSEAVSLFEVRAFDLLISDINLGNGSGLELIRHVRRTSEVPAIAMSGQPDMSGPSLASGFSVFLEKPVSKLCLQRTIRLVVSKSPVPELGSEALLRIPESNCPISDPGFQIAKDCPEIIRDR